MSKRIISTLTALMGAGVLAANAAPKGADTILANDPHGFIVSIVSVSIVISALILLSILISVFANVMVRSAHRKSAASRGVDPAVKCDSVDNGEIIAAITLALRLSRMEQHDQESTVITINKVARAYSPWSSKIYGLTQLPNHK